MKKIFFLSFIFNLFLTTSFYSQVQQEWVQRYNSGNGVNWARSLTVDGSGNVYVTGWSQGNGTGYDYATVKYNSSGVQQWIQRYNGPGNGDDWANAIAVDGSGNVYVTGGIMINDTSSNYATIKYNSSGVQQWVQEYGGEATSLAVDGSGNVYVTGSSMGNGTGSDYATIKYNTNGIQQWVQRYNGPGNGNDEARSIAVDGSGNVYVSGESGGNATALDYATIKYNSSGVQMWVQRYNGPGNGDDVATSIAVDGSGNVYITGWSWGNGTSYDYATIRYDASGVQQWVAIYNGPANLDDEATSIAVDGSGNVYVTGWSWGNGTSEDYATIKYNTNGVQQWIQRYNDTGNGNDRAYSITVDGSGNVYVTGYSSSGADYTTIKYSQNIGIKRISSEVPDRYALYQNYPNPFNPTTKIKFEIPDFPLMKGVRGMSVRLTIYDILGRGIAPLVNQPLQPGSYEVEWDASNYPSGVYFYRLQANDFMKTMKMVLIK
ncbi:MAG: SBBP repeat-containing protein [Ignavibacteria bacterium]